LTAAVAAASTVALAQDMTIVSWGGAYSASQLHAYHEPYTAKTGVQIINDNSSAEAVAKLRAMNEAGNVTWDVVDVVAADAMRLCDEGLAEVIDADNQLAPAPDALPRLLISASCWFQSVSFPRSFTQPPSAIVPTWCLKRRPMSVLSSTWRSSLASVRWKSAPSTTWSGLCCVTA